jgi:hypothetical protein
MNDEKKKQSNEEWYDDKCMEAIKKKIVARQTMEKIYKNK